MFGEDYSESPRLPSPWEALASSTATATTASSGTDTPSSSASSALIYHRLIPESDEVGHIEYKLRLPGSPSIDRLARLTSQLLWRIKEGGGEAIYEIGVCDNGWVLGIEEDEMRSSLETLVQMASGLGARVDLLREIRMDPQSGASSTRSGTFSTDGTPLRRSSGIRNGQTSGRATPSSVASEYDVGPGGQSKKKSMLIFKEKAKGKKARRRARRERDIMASAAAERENGGRSKVFRAVVKDPFEMDEDQEEEQGMFDLSLDVEVLDDAGSSYTNIPPVTAIPHRTLSVTGRIFPSTLLCSTPPTVDDLPSLSHSPESSPSRAPSQAAEDPIELARQDGRKQERKVWKKERMAYKRRLLARSAAEARGEIYHSENEEHPIVPATQEDLYLDCLVAVFDGVQLEEKADAGLAQYGQGSDAQKRMRKRELKARRRENMQRRAEEHAAALLLHQQEQAILAAAAEQQVASGSDSVVEGLKPIPRLAAEQNGKKEARRASGLERWVVECLVYYPDVDASVQDEDGEDGSESGGHSGSSSNGRDELFGVSQGSERRLQRYIDFEGAHASL